MVSVTRVNHPETIPPPVVCGKIVFHKTSPWCPKGWGPLMVIKEVTYYNETVSFSGLHVRPEIQLPVSGQESYCVFTRGQLSTFQGNRRA